MRDKTCPSCGIGLRLKKRYFAAMALLALFLVSPFAIVFVISRMVVPTTLPSPRPRGLKPRCKITEKRTPSFPARWQN